MIDREDYQAFVWIRDNISEDYNKAILDLWKTTTFTAITGKPVFTRIHTAPGAQDYKAYDFLRRGGRDTIFLKENGIPLVYTRLYETGWGQNVEYKSLNPDLIEVGKNIYRLKKPEGKEQGGSC